MQTPIHTPDESATALGAFFCLVWLVVILWWIAAKSRVVADTVAWFRRKGGLARIFIVCALLTVVAIGGSKSGMRTPAASPLTATLPVSASPSLDVVSIHTNGVALRAESTNAVEVTAFRTVGGTELGDWIEIDVPFFAVGTNPVSRCYVSASGSVSFETMRRPPVGSALPDGTGLPVLCPLRAPLGMVPEARWAQVFGPDAPGSRFWHDALPGGGRVLTWENALVDRLPGRRVSLQVEMRPSGDSVFKFRFQCTGFNDSDCFLVLPLSGASVDSVIASEIAAADAFAARVRAKYPGWVARNSRDNGLKWFVNYGAGDFRGRPDSHASPTVWYYNQVNDRSKFGAIATWGGKCVRLSKVSNFIDAYACQKIGVTALNQSIAQMIGTRNSVSGTTSWDCGVELANGTMTLAECAEWIATSCWNEGDEKVRRLWPNLAPADNFVEPGLFSNPNTQFTIPGFLRMTDP